MDKDIKNPKITVLMPAYNTEKYIADSIDSILSQTFEDFELLIINDGSTDKSENIILSFNDPRIRYIKNEQNMGLTKVRNLGLELVRGEYIAMLDSDDIAHSTRLAKQVNFLDKNQTYGIIGTWVRLIDVNSRSTDVKWKNNLLPEEIPPTMLLHNCLSQSSVMLRASAIRDEKYREGYAPAEDYDLWVRIAKKWKIAILSEVLVDYRTNPNGQSKTKKEEQSRAVAKIVTTQLGSLGIGPTNNELSIHLANDMAKDYGILLFLEKREAWLNRLILANHSKKSYNEITFNSAMGKAWLKNCYAISSKGYLVWKKFWKSNLSNNTRLRDWKDILKFFIKCLARGNKI